jgi:hypothetical protein
LLAARFTHPGQRAAADIFEQIKNAKTDGRTVNKY